MRKLFLFIFLSLPIFAMELDSELFELPLRQLFSRVIVCKVREKPIPKPLQVPLKRISVSQLKTPQVSGQEQGDWEVVTLECTDITNIIFHARGRLIGDQLIAKRLHLKEAQQKNDQEVIAELEWEIEELNKQTIQFAKEQREWLLDLALLEREQKGL